MKSLDPGRSTDDLVEDIERSIRELDPLLQKGLVRARASVRRSEKLPIIPDVHELLVRVDWDTVEGVIKTGTISFVTREVLTWLKGKFKNLSANVVKAPRHGAKKTAARKKASAKAAQKKKRKKRRK